MYNVGDRVVYTGMAYRHLIGERGTIKAIDEWNGTVLLVEFDNAKCDRLYLGDYHFTPEHLYKEEMHKPTYTDQISAVFEAQRAKGLAKYGVDLENGTVGVMEVIDHALEEAADLMQYLTHLKAKLSELYK